MGAVTSIRAIEAISDDAAFAVWRLEMQVANCSRRTLEERAILVRSLGRFLGAPVITASRTDLMQWLARPHLSPRTRKNYKSFLHTFYTVLQDEGYRVDNPAARLPRSRAPRSEPNPFTTADVQKLLDSGTYARTRMMVLLAAYQGFRATEIASTAGNHINWDRHEILSVDAKGGVEVWRPLHPAVLAEALANPQRFSREGWWFPGISANSGGHINAKSVSSTLTMAIKRAGIPHRPHQLRGWFATELMESGADMLTIVHAMRHAGPETLKYYIKPSMIKVDDAMRRLPDLVVPTMTRSAAATCIVGGCEEPRADAKHGRRCARHRYQAEKAYYATRNRAKTGS
jgi:integrase/recombinase XerD